VDTVHECDGRTDRQTDGRRITITKQYNYAERRTVKTEDTRKNTKSLPLCLTTSLMKVKGS